MVVKHYDGCTQHKFIFRKGRAIGTTAYRPKTTLIKTVKKLGKKTMFYDIETEWLVNGHPINDSKFKVGGVYIADEQRYLKFEDADKMCLCLNKADCLVGYNNVSFDDRILLKHGLNPEIRRVDIFQLCKAKCSIPGIYLRKRKCKWPVISSGKKICKWPSLDELMQINFKTRKADYKREDFKQLSKHCKDDVTYTHKLGMLMISKGFRMPIEKLR